jgi:hypothetical protein
MSLPGGAADKLGNRFETRWTILLRIPLENDRGFRSNPITDSAAIRSVIPLQSDR